MTIQSLHDWYNILLDHYNEPYFNSAEIDRFINNGAISFVTDIVFKEFFPVLGENEKGAQVLDSMESVSQGLEMIQPLVFANIPVVLSAGIAPNEWINSTLRAITGDENDSVMHIVSVSHTLDGEERVVGFVRHNDRVRFKANVFKTPSEKNPKYSIVRQGLLVEPSIDIVNITIVKYPRKVSLLNNITLDLPEIAHQKVIAHAIAQSGVASRDDVLLQLQRMSGNGTDRQQ